MPSYFEYEELAALILAKGDSEAADLIIDSGETPDHLWEKYEIDFDQFCKTVDFLINYTVQTTSPLTGTTYKGFVHNGSYVIKKEVEGYE